MQSEKIGRSPPSCKQADRTLGWQRRRFQRESAGEQ